MAGSLKDQLLKAGVASKKQAKQVELDQRKQKKQKKPPTDQATAQHLEAARLEKIEKDRLLNEQRKKEQDRKAALAEIKQLAQQHQVRPPSQADVRYNFIYDSKVKHIWIDSALQKQLALKQLTLVAVEAKFILVPTDIAQRIIQRDPLAVVQDEEERKKQIAAEEAEYADYAIPDDLDW
ncbi:DUF2058 domain-containing protein [Nitrincola tibetensis]|uniref:DUF2058 domain-containing protein n=1 Tax=Nitrincola tibetensis TaxID=2219697 RepID=A0A364NRY8_9GAMM|nr:DUF2058 family protein [Nitrincola tibetensis]RAU19792.1 DUF2058 domain-containing protein [Nitrincola tibetensis]